MRNKYRIIGCIGAMSILVSTNVFGAEFYNGHKYELIDESMSWTEAKAYCEKLGTVTSQEENQFLTNMLLEKGTKNQYWLGGEYHDKVGSWITGEEFKYTNITDYDFNNIDDQPYLQLCREHPSYSDQHVVLGAWVDNADYGMPGTEWDNAYAGLIVIGFLA